MKAIKGLLIDVDGVLIENEHALKGAVDRLNAIRNNYSIRLLTNTTTKQKVEIYQMLTRLGFIIQQDEIITAPLAAQILLKDKGCSRIYPVVNQNILSEFESFEIDKNKPEAVVIGDIGTTWSYELLNRIFKYLMNGAELIALHKGKFWKSEGTLQLDIGMFIDGLEYATGKMATVIGKPSKSFFNAALTSIGLPKEAVLMIGDDIDGDIYGAQNVGIKAYLVKTGKYNVQFVSQSSVRPDKTINSFAELKW
ncbi:MAG: TIGR01458 family HAD-type hydrolase [Reichenbachiella sp.]|uniref:TIGR01458 family HAD-type hydrolase n=1 Tax=Reichenbachiella sp. TaxID=2184521 RepID=UPI0029670486|nr:TIGR01458 family HAD-type hydrolase [Reichenbachiella sp.]MDW3210628.1 TIGR01458 family HAD-type hydrolase [Reichenbachiella sp.]